jgi:hypothetical protein
MIRRCARRALALALLTAGCTVQHTTEPDAGLQALRAEVAALRTAAGARLAADTMLLYAVRNEKEIAVGLRVAALRDILSTAANRYLRSVQLHLRPNVVVRESDTVRMRLGPLNIEAGTWDLAVTIRRVDALLSAEAINVVVAGSNRLDVTVPIHVSNGTGVALIDFRWDAAAATSIVCGDFAVREPFTGYVAPRTYQVRGSFTLINQHGGVIARPVVHHRILVSPQPTQASWARVREILNEQNHIFKCGIPMSPSRMETMLRDLLTKGFRFRLPSSIIREVPLPGSFVEHVDVAGRRAIVSIEPVPPELTPDWLWVRASVRALASGDAPIRVDPGR